MKISTKGRYALRLMTDIAAHDEGGYVSLKDVAARQDISLKYLEQIGSILTKAGFLHSGRGAQGGYRLAKAPECYTVGSILRLTEADSCSCRLPGGPGKPMPAVRGMPHTGLLERALSGRERVYGPLHAGRPAGGTAAKTATVTPSNDKDAPHCRSAVRGIFDMFPFVVLDLGTGRHDLFADMGILFEVFDEADRQLLATGPISLLILPGVLRDQQLRGHALDLGRHLDAKGGIGDELALFESRR